MPASTRTIPKMTVTILTALAVALGGLASVGVSHAYAATAAKPAISSVKSSAVGQITITVKKAKNAKGYQYWASTSKKFDKAATYDLASTKLKKTTATLKNLREGATYYVKVRAYNSKGKYGKWSAVKSVKVKASTALKDAKAEAAKWKKDAEDAKAAAETAKSEAATAKSDADELKTRAEAAEAEVERLKAELEQYEQAQPGQPITITYNLDGGSFDEDPKTSLAEGDGEYTLPTPKKDGYVFKGWVDQAGNQVASVVYAAGSITVTATWEKQPLAYIYVDAGKRSAKTTEWDEDSGSYVSIKLYELYVDKGENAPSVGDEYQGGTVASVSESADETNYPAGSITLLATTPFDDIPSMKECTEVDLSKADASSTTSMWFAFSGCSELESIDLSGLDTSNVTDMQWMFAGCSSLASLTLTGVDTSKVTNMDCMFSRCTSLTSLDVSGFDTKNVTSMIGMFDGCESLTALDLSGFDTGNVTNMAGMLRGCSELQTLNISGFNTSKVTKMSNMFANCSSLTSLEVSGFNTSGVTDLSEMFAGCSSLTALDVSGFDTKNVTNMVDMFLECSSLKSLDVSGFDTRKVRDMTYMFAWCSSLESLDVSGFSTGSVTSMNGMFLDCETLEAIDVSGFDTSSVTNMEAMFQECKSIKTLDVSHFDTRNTASFNQMFAFCHSLTNLDLSSFDTINATSMISMFGDSPSIESLITGNAWTTELCSSKPFFPVDMYDETGNAYEARSVIPDGAHTYTVENPTQGNSVSPLSDSGTQSNPQPPAVDYPGQTSEPTTDDQPGGSTSNESQQPEAANEASQPNADAPTQDEATPADDSLQNEPEAG